MVVEYKELFKAVAERPGMYLADESLACYISFISGYDYAYHKKPLSGFREWLIKKRHIGSNQVWGAVIFTITADSEQERILLCHQLMSEYFQSTQLNNVEN